MRYSIFVSVLLLSTILHGCSTANQNLKGDGDEFDSHINRGKTFRKGGQLAEALSEFKSAVSIRSDSDEAHFLLGYVYFQMYLRSHDEAQRKYLRDFFMSGKSTDPNISSDELRRIYESYGERTDYDTQANIEFAMAAKLNSKNYMAHYFVAVNHLNNKRFKDAVQEYKQALSANPNHEISYSGLGKAYYELGQYELAIENYKKAILLSTEMSDTDYQLGLAYLKVGQKENAIEILEKMKTNNAEFSYNSLYLAIYGQYPPEFQKKLNGE